VKTVSVSPVTPGNLAALIARLERARRRLADCGTAALISEWTSAAHRFLREMDRGAVAHLAETTGFYESDLRDWLGHLFAYLANERHWQEWLSRECSQPSAFDHPYSISDGIAIRQGFDRALVVQGGGIPLTVLPVVAALSLARTPTAVRIGRHDPASLITFLRMAQSVAPVLAQSIIPISFPHDDTAMTAKIFKAFPLVVAFGSNERLAEIGAQMVPHQRFIAFGSRFSLAFVDREAAANALTTARQARPAPEDSLFRRLARDALMFDKQGCFSVHGVILRVTDGEAARAFSERLLRAMIAELRLRRSSQDRLADSSLRSALSVHESVARWAQFGVGKVFARRDHFVPAVVLMDGSRLPPPSGGPLVWVAPVPSIRRALGLLRPYRDYLSTLVVACSPDNAPEIVETFAGAGFHRFCEPGAAQFPLPFAPHDGVPLLSAVSRLSVFERP
jgi:hypothetical protein